jgi:hypothetical protein
MRAITILKISIVIGCVTSVAVAAMLQTGFPPQGNNCEMITTAGGTTTCVASGGSGGGGTQQAALQGGAVWTVTTDKPEVWSYLPETVTVPFGETEAVYYGEVAGSAPTGWVSVTVSGGGVSKTANVYIAE